MRDGKQEYDTNRDSEKDVKFTLKRKGSQIQEDDESDDENSS